MKYPVPPKGRIFEDGVGYCENQKEKWIKVYAEDMYEIMMEMLTKDEWGNIIPKDAFGPYHEAAKKFVKVARKIED